MRWYKKAAEQGNAHSQHNLGGLFFNGHGVAQNYLKAVVWVKKAAEQGYVDAQGRLTLMFDQSQGVPQNDELAARYYKIAAKQGEIARKFLGQYYLLGCGVA